VYKEKQKATKDYANITFFTKLFISPSNTHRKQAAMKLCKSNSFCHKVEIKIHEKLETILTLLRQIGIPPPTVAPWREALYKDRQSNRRVGVF